MISMPEWVSEGLTDCQALVLKMLSHLKIIFSQKSPSKCDFCWTHFPITRLCQSIADIWPLTTLLFGLSIVFPRFLVSKWAIVKPIEVENVGVMNILVKSFLGQKKWKNSFLSYKCNFCILCHYNFFLNSFTIKNRDSEVFKYVWHLYRVPQKKEGHSVLP